MIEKIGVIGGGNIGGVLVSEIVSRRLARRVGLVDVKPPELAKGKCLDIAEGTAVVGRDVRLEGSKTYEVLAGADVRDQHGRRPPRRAAGRDLPVAGGVARDQPQDHRRGRRRDPRPLPGRLRDLDRESAGRDRLPSAQEVARRWCPPAS